MSAPHWTTTTLQDRDVFDLLNGLWKGKSGPLASATVVRNTDFSRFATLDLDKAAVLEVEERQLASRRLREGDIVVERSGGGPKQPVGRVAYFEHTSTAPYSFSNFTSAIRVRNTGRALPRFIAYYLLYLYHSGATVPLQRATTGLRNLDWQAYTSLPIPLPPLDDQHRIVEALLAVDRALRAEERAVLLLNKARTIASDLMFSHGLPGGDSEDGYPQRWKPAVFEDLATLHRGFDLPVAERRPGPVPVIGSNGVVGMHDESKCSGPGVMTGRSGSIGLSFYVEGPHWPLNTSLYVSDFHGNEPLFVHFFIRHFDLERFAAGVSVPTLNRNLVHKAAIRFPDKPEQRRIAEDLQALELAEANASKRSSLLRELFLALLDRLMIGKLSIQNLRLDRSEVSNV